MGIRLGRYELQPREDEMDLASLLREEDQEEVFVKEN
jgi:hypothetical protein